MLYVFAVLADTEGQNYTTVADSGRPPFFSANALARGEGVAPCALARAPVSAFHNAGSCTQAMKKRNIRTFFTVTSVTKRSREESYSSFLVGN